MTFIFDLESRPDMLRLQNPELMLGSLQGMVVLDEIQEMPELFSVIRVLVDRPDNKVRFLILGSASPDIVKNVSETLAGRIEFIELSGFNLNEAGTFMVRQLQPWFENIKKRQVKAPKIYLRDSGLLHSLLSLESMPNLMGHPKVGASWEGFAIEQFLKAVKPSEAYFWATHGGAEIDLFFLYRGHRYGVEVTYTEAPRVTKSMRTAVVDLGLEKLWVIYPGSQMYPMDDKISTCPLDQIGDLHEVGAKNFSPLQPCRPD